jgi:uncharacterized repeat protein (TIGR02543 family)
MNLKRNISVLLIITLILFTSIAFSQTTIGTKEISMDLKTYSNVFPPSPTEAALGKYGSFPVSLYTGTPNISIPLFEIRNKNLSVPISLSYHASGIKVEERAGWVGLGWSLNAGGIITRTVVGKPDEQTYTGYWEMVKNIPPTDISNIAFNNYVPSYYDLGSNITGENDLEPDQFSFNFMGFSGSFLVDPYQTSGVRNCYIFPQADIEIKYTNGTFTATDYKGVVYTFDRMNSVTTNVKTTVSAYLEVAPETLAYITTWYLTRIHDPNTGAYIYFGYDNKVEKYADRMVSSENFLMLGTHYTTHTENEYSATSCFISSISGGDQKVDFAIGDRLGSDMDQGYVLDGCTLSSVDNPSNNISYSFIYGYPSDRLFLNSINKKGINNEDGGSYQFEYYYYTGIPARDSYSRDYWGFYNGRANSTLFYPYVMDVFPTTANLRPDETGTYMQAGSLKSITYPTKGTTTFEYEPNQFGQTSTTIGIPDMATTNEIGRVVEVSYQGQSITESEPFTIDYDQTVTINTPAGFQPDFFYIQYGLSNSSSLTDLYFPQSSQQVFLQAGTYVLVLHQIKLEEQEGDINEFNSVSVSYSSITTGTGTETSTSYYAGGLRIKRIVNRSDGEVVNTKEYGYNLWNDELTAGSSSGVLAGFESNYLSKYAKIQDAGIGIPEIRQIWQQRVNASSVNHPLTQGSSVGYTQVEERDYANGVSNGFILHKFDSPSDGLADDIYSVHLFSGTGSYNVPGTPTYLSAVRDQRSYLTGKLLSKTYFNSSNFKVMEESYNYSSPPKTYSIPGIKTGILYHNLSYDLGISDKHQFVYIKYQRSAYTTSLLSKTVNYYAGNSNTDAAYGSTLTSYTRNSKNQIEKEEVKMLGEGSIITNEYYYPNSINIPITVDQQLQALQNMTNMGMYAIPILSLTKKNGVLTEQVKRNYSPIQPILLESIDEYDVAKEKSYNTSSFYYSYGNVVQLNKPGDYFESYHWIHDLPVAKFINTPYYEIVNNLDLKNFLNSLESITTLSDECDRTALKSLNNSIRALVPNSVLVTTYTYHPLFGMTSQTDPNGITTYYEYDGLGRLIHIRDHQENIIKQYDYHYQGQSLANSTFCSVNFDLQDGGAVNSRTILSNSNISVPVSPVKTGFTFEGWYKEAACINAWNFSTDAVTTDTTLYANWTINTYLVTFNPQGGSTVAGVSAIYNTTISAPAVPTRTGYTFGGWYRESGCTTPWNFSADVVSASTALYAKWTISSYAVIFNSQGGSTVSSINANYNTTIVTPPAPTLMGCTFAGWYKDGQCWTEWSFTTDVVTANTTLYAKWTIVIVASVVGNGGTITPSGTSAVIYGGRETYTFSPSTGYHIKDVRVNFSSIGAVSSYTFVNVTLNQMLSVAFEINSNTVTFDSQGGSSVSSVTATYGSTISAPTAPTRTGYTFGGWYKESTCTNAWNFTTDMVIAATTLYAKWTICSYTVTFNSQGGSTVSSINASYNTTIVVPTAPTRPGYTFGGWYKESACTNAWSFTADVVTTATTLYAKWTGINCTVTFNPQGGSCSVTSLTVPYGSTIRIPIATRIDCPFEGWYKDSTCTTAWNSTDVVRGNITLYAKWACDFIEW